MRISKHARNYRIVAIVVVTLCTTVLLSLLTHIAGPKLSRVLYDNPDSTSTITLQTNSILNENSAPNITINPEIAFEPSFVGSAILLRLQQPLRTDTSYTITAHDVTDQRGNNSTLTHSFTTKPAQFTYLDRSDELSNQIVAKTVLGDSETLHEADRLFDFSHGKNSLVTIENDLGQLVFKQVLPDENSIRLNDDPTSNAQAIYGTHHSDLYVLKINFESRFDTQSYVFDASTGAIQPILDEQDEFIRIDSVLFADDGETIIYTDRQDFSMYVRSLTTNKPSILLGAASNLLRYMPHDRGVVFTRPNSVPGQIETLNPITRQSSVSDFSGSVNSATVASDNTGFFLEAIYTANSGFQNLVRERDGAIENIAKIGQNLRGFSVEINDNDDLVAVQTARNPVVYDNYSTNSLPKNSQLEIYNDDGLLLEAVPGAQIQWR